jgi:hypothetical protein
MSKTALKLAPKPDSHAVLPSFHPGRTIDLTEKRNLEPGQYLTEVDGKRLDREKTREIQRQFAEQHRQECIAAFKSYYVDQIKNLTDDQILAKFTDGRWGIATEVVARYVSSLSNKNEQIPGGSKEELTESKNDKCEGSIFQSGYQFGSFACQLNNSFSFNRGETILTSAEYRNKDIFRNNNYIDPFTGELPKYSGNNCIILERFQAMMDRYSKGNAPISAETFIGICDKYGLDATLALAQAIQESHIGTNGKRPQSTKNIFNVGNTDDGSNRDMATWENGMEEYAKLMVSSYGSSAEQVLANEFKNKSGYRYATDPRYTGCVMNLVAKIRQDVIKIKTDVAMDSKTFLGLLRPKS